ncbi:MAG TPA: GtrA family protein, partial [Candidatus Acidoferrum sp.]|nr:GtrA family protein [Candidatus Acidoferrum sp.]
MLTRQFLIYVAVGVLCATIDLGTLQLLLITGSPPTQAVTIAFVLALVCNYLFHLRLTFRASHDGATLLRFLVLVLLNYGLTLGC